MLHIDRASNVGGSRVRIILASLDGNVAEQALHFSFKTLNNEAKYKALLVRLRLAYKFGIHHLIALSNSQLIIGQVHGEYEALAPTMEKYLEKV